jgi:hypothetical protein
MRQDVVGFQVPMKYVLGVHVLDSGQDLLEDASAMAPWPSQALTAFFKTLNGKPHFKHFKKVFSSRIEHVLPLQYKIGLKN